MEKESINIQVSAEELTQIVRGAIRDLLGELVNCRPQDQLITVDNRCRQLWPNAQKKHQWRIRDVFVARHLEELGRRPGKLTGHLNGVIVCEREYLHILDGAIDTIKNEVEGHDFGSLFS